MGDKSPKSNQKKSAQKKARAKKADEKRKKAIAKKSLGNNNWPSLIRIKLKNYYFVSAD